MENIKCDKCNKEFSLEVRDINTKVIDDIQVSYFECKHCNHEYITTCRDKYIDKEYIRHQRLKQEIDSLEALRRKDSRFTYKHQEELIKLKGKKLKCLKNMKAHSDRLKDKIKNRVI